MSSIVVPARFSYAQSLPITVLNLPLPGNMISLTPAFEPVLVKGLTVHPQNPLEFDFIIHKGDTGLEGQALNEEATKLVKYFLATLTIPEDELWVNLSPYEKDRIIPDNFIKTEMGRDLLAQDYVLKQLTASLMFPDNELGNKFWQRVYSKAQALYGTTDIPLNTFNKIWIVPDQALVYEQGNSAFVIKKHLKVMLEEDYVAMSNQKDIAESRDLSRDLLAASDQSSVTSENTGDRRSPEIALRFRGLNPGKAEPSTGQATSDDQNKKIPAEIVREILVPEIEREVNEGQTFAPLRQIYNSMILAAWYKKNLKETLLSRVYVDQNKTQGINVDDPQVKQKIYAQYLEAFKKGVYNYIKEEIDPATHEVIPRKYFSGGMMMTTGVKDVASVRGPDAFGDLPYNDRSTAAVELAGLGSDALDFNVALVEDTGTAAQKAAADIARAATATPAPHLEPTDTAMLADGNIIIALEKPWASPRTVGRQLGIDHVGPTPGAVRHFLGRHTENKKLPVYVKTSAGVEVVNVQEALGLAQDSSIAYEIKGARPGIILYIDPSDELLKAQRIYELESQKDEAAVKELFQIIDNNWNEGLMEEAIRAEEHSVDV
ncbi:MAG: hypothetical protein Q7S13_06275 [Candidatus Omnitrophota bacterium]|nr:hypothetical protein [Candidatus Omnitrophota bacterium]